jgi:O-antigen/teichoic acid export membrane protein
MPSENNKRIAKNTMLLYFRMIIVTSVSLFTTRIILKILGVEDFGIYNVIGGIIGFLGVANVAMISATQRFLTIELGRGNIKRYNQIFSMLIAIFIFLSLLVIVIACVFSSWLINDFLVIPKERLHIATWLYFFSVFSFVFFLISIPYISSIIAYEKMGIYAYISLVDVILKLILVYTIYISPFDKLLTYGFLIMCVGTFSTFFNFFYCRYKLLGCKFHFFWEKSLLKQLLGFIGWNLFGSVTAMLNWQGQSIILNIFFGPIVNAAKAIADKINYAVISFSQNFYVAVVPQIIKHYAAGELDQMFNLVIKSTKYSFYLLFILTLPLVLLMPEILNIWLGNEQVSKDMIIFSQLILIYSLVNSFEQPITAAIQATGNIKNYEIIVGSITLLLLPICYFLFKMGLPAYYSLIILIIIYTIAQVFRILIAKYQLGLSIKLYSTSIFIPIILSSVPSAIISYYLCKILPNNILGLGFSIISSFLISLGFIFLLGINNIERAKVACQVRDIIKKIGNFNKK